MQINILTLFPDFFKSCLDSSILGRAQKAGLVKFKIINIRDFALDKHHITDERPFGGGPGMVMKVEPIDQALQSLESFSRHKKDVNAQVKDASNFTGQAEFKSKVILTSAKGKLFTQQLAQEYSGLDELTIICGHYEGVDERVAQHLVDEEVRIGDYVLTGGEGAALVISDAVSRLIKGVLGNEESNQNESHGEIGEMSHPVYTQPREYKGWTVPEILLSGDHQKIKAWREEQRKKI